MEGFDWLRPMLQLARRNRFERRNYLEPLVSLSEEKVLLLVKEARSDY